MLKRVLNSLFFLLCLDVVIDPGNSILGIKELLFIATFCFGIIYCIQYKISLINKNVLLLCLFWGLLLPMYGLSMGILRNQFFDWGFGIMYVKSFLFIWILLLHNTDIPFGKYLSISSLFIIIPTLYTYLTVSHFDPQKTYYFVENNAMFISRRSFAGQIVDPVIYYKTSTLAIFGVGWLCSSLRFTKSKLNKVVKILLLSVISFVLYFSFSRAILISITIILLYYLYHRIKNIKLFKQLFFLSIISGILVGLPIIFSKVLFVQGEYANMIKFGHTLSYIELFKNDPLTLLLGQGLGAGFYSSGINDIIYMSEVSYLELVRFFGLFGTMLIILALFYPLIFYLKNKTRIIPSVKYIYLAYALYLFCVGTNPLLISSTGMIVLVVVYSTIFTKKHLLL